MMEMVEHLSPKTPPILWVNHIGVGKHVEVLVNYINKKSKLKAEIAKHGIRVEMGHIYLCPGGHHLTVYENRSVLYLNVSSEDPYKGCLPSVNLLFLSGAEVCRTHKVLAFVLTGMGNDGLEGCRALRKNNAEVITQSADTCMIYGMPKAVDQERLSSYSMSPDEIVNLLNQPMNSLHKILLNKRNFDGQKMEPVGFSERRLDDRKKSDNQDEIREDNVIGLFRKMVVKITGNVTFEDKPELLKSKLRKFLRLENCRDFVELYEKCRHDDILLKYIVGEMTIDESMFFRDKIPFEFLKAIVFAQSQNMDLKIWSACCALGQEAYSIAMTLDEFRQEQRSKLDAHIYATDIDVTCLRQAEAGIYSKFQVLRGLREHHLENYFEQDEKNNKFIVKDRLKRKILFSNFNLLEEEFDKFKDMDVIFCRYSLIYFDEKLQLKVLDRLVDSLKPRGFLILDPAISMKTQHHQLEAMSYQKSTFFRKRAA